MKRERIQKLIDEIEAIIEDTGNEKRPIPYDAPPDAGAKRILALAKLDAAKDLLMIAARDL